MPDDVLGIQLPQCRTHARAPVAALGSVAAITKTRHQGCPGAGDPLDVPAHLGRLVAPAVSRQRRNDTVETRLVQRPDDLEELDHRARPPMGEHQRKRVRVGRSGVQEVDAEPVDGRPKLPDAVQPRLGPAPVVPIGPIGAKHSQLLKSDALGRIGRRLRPPRCPQPRPEIIELTLGNREMERRDVGIWHVAMVAASTEPDKELDPHHQRSGRSSPTRPFRGRTDQLPTIQDARIARRFFLDTCSGLHGALRLTATRARPVEMRPHDRLGNGRRGVE